ncbi:MAG: DUF885 domain-containing protein [Verrucomicrobiota bacterium]
MRDRARHLKSRGRVSQLVQRFGLAVFLFFIACDATTQKDDLLLRELMDRIWAWQLDVYPESGTYHGFSEGNDRWTDQSLEAIRARQKKNKAWNDKIESFDHLPLSNSERLEFAILRAQYEKRIAGQAFPWELMPISQLTGVQHSPARVLKIMPKNNLQDYQRILSRLEKLPALIRQYIELMKEGLMQGFTPPQVVMQSVPEQVAIYLTEEWALNPLWVPFRRVDEALSQQESEQVLSKAKSLLLGPVKEAYSDLYTYLTNEYIPKCRTDVGILHLPNGRDWYAHLVKSMTTTDLTPDQIHQIGIQEVDRIYQEMKTLAKRNGHDKVQAYAESLYKEERYFCNSKEELLKEYRALCKKIDAKVVGFFGVMPRLPYGIELIPEHAEKSAPLAYFSSGSLKAARAGVFYVNGHNLRNHPRWGMEALAIHEAVPGHHFQLALAEELEHKHDLLKNTWFTAYGEGWALYCEKLGKEMGFYETDASEFGRLGYEIWRAVRLVVDTGMHEMSWERQQAIDYFLKYTPKSLQEIEVEVDRYLVWPGQALSYKIGELKMWELRHLAEESLGDHFDLKAFHDLVLSNGALPLDILETLVREWLSSGHN